MSTARSYLPYALDVLLLVALLLLFSPRMTGLPIHEWLGLALGLPVLLHLLLSWRWIAKATAGVFSRATTRTKVNYALNALLFAMVVIEIVSGAMISAIAVPTFGIGTVNDRAWRALHNLCLNWTLLLLGLHVAVNWQPLRRALRSMLAGTPDLPAGD